MKSFIDEFTLQLKVEIDYSVESNLKSFKEEVLETLYKDYKLNNVDCLLLSDGMDSRFLSLCIRELNIPITCISFAFNNELNEIKQRINDHVKKYNLKHEYFFVEKEKFFKHLDFLTFDKNIAYPVINGYYIDFVLNNFKNSKFFSGASCEFKLYDCQYIVLGMSNPYFMNINNPKQLFGFYNSRCFLSYINSPIFLSNYDRNPKTLYRSDEWFIRDLIYQSCFPDLTVNLKGLYEDKEIVSEYNRHYHKKIIEKHPFFFSIKNFNFNVANYFKK